VPALRVLVLEKLHCLKRHLGDGVFRAVARARVST
jgi:hypothetical protein